MNQSFIDLESFSELARQIPQGLMILSPDHTILFVNAKAAGMLRQNESDIIGKSLQHFFVLNEKDLGQAGEILHFTRYLPKLYPLVGIHYTATQFSDGNFALYLEGRFQEAESNDETQKMKGFVSALTHEIRTPSNVISNAASLLCMQSKDPEKSRKYLRIIRKNLAIVRRVAKYLLILSKNQELGWSCNFRHADIIAFLDNTICDIEDFAASYGLQLKREFHVNKADALFDPEMMDKILVNLISNAIKFSPPQSEIVLYTKRKDEHTLLIGVKDHGIGISREDLPTIYDKFKQVDSTAQENQGSGIGLYIVKMFCEKMGFSIACKSQPGSGAEFILSIPVTGIAAGEYLKEDTCYETPEYRLHELEIEFVDTFLEH